MPDIYPGNDSRLTIHGPVASRKAAKRAKIRTLFCAQIDSSARTHSRVKIIDDSRLTIRRGPALIFFQRVFEIGDEIFHVLHTDAKADE